MKTDMVQIFVKDKCAAEKVKTLINNLFPGRFDDVEVNGRMVHQDYEIVVTFSEPEPKKWIEGFLTGAYFAFMRK